MNDMQKMRVATICCAMCVGVSTLVSAQESFTDTFSNPLAADRQPVTWVPLDNSEISISGGVMTITGPPAELAGAFTLDFSATDLVVDTEFEVIQGTDIGVVLRAGDTQCYFANYVRRVERISIGEGCQTTSPPITLRAADVPFPTDTPLRMQFRAIDDELDLWFWPANEPRPEEPMVQLTHRGVSGAGSVGFFVNETVAVDTPPQVRVHEFAVTVVPEPSTGLLACLALPWMVRRRRTPRL